MARKVINRVAAEKGKLLPGGCLKESDYLVRRFTAKVPVTHTLKDIEAPNYFQFYADTLAKARGFGPVKLEVISDDCSLHAEYLVLEATRGGVRLRRITVHYDASQIPEAPEGSLQDTTGNDLEFTKNWSAKEKNRILQHGKVVLQNIQSKDMCDEILDRLNAGTLDLDDVATEYSVSA